MLVDRKNFFHVLRICRFFFAQSALRKFPALGGTHTNRDSSGGKRVVPFRRLTYTTHYHSSAIVTAAAVWEATGKFVRSDHLTPKLGNF